MRNEELSSFATITISLPGATFGATGVLLGGVLSTYYMYFTVKCSISMKKQAGLERKHYVIWVVAWLFFSLVLSTSLALPGIKSFRNFYGPMDPKHPVHFWGKLRFGIKCSQTNCAFTSYSLFFNDNSIFGRYLSLVLENK